MNYHLAHTIDLTQKLLLTPSITQSLSILKMNSQELYEFVEETVDHLVKEDKPIVREFWPDTLKDSFGPIGTSNGGMEEYLRDQLLLEKKCKGMERKALYYLIQNLTDRGYLKCSIEEVQTKFHMTFDEATNVLAILQSFEPAGIGARSLSECLQLQLRCYTNIPAYTESIIVHHLELVATKDLRALCLTYNCTIDEINEAIDFIKSLNPYPIESLSKVHLLYENRTTRDITKLHVVVKPIQSSFLGKYPESWILLGGCNR